MSTTTTTTLEPPWSHRHSRHFRQALCGSCMRSVHITSMNDKMISARWYTFFLYVCRVPMMVNHIEWPTNAQRMKHTNIHHTNTHRERCCSSKDGGHCLKAIGPPSARKAWKKKKTTIFRGLDSPFSTSHTWNTLKSKEFCVTFNILAVNICANSFGYHARIHPWNILCMETRSLCPQIVFISYSLHTKLSFSSVIYVKYPQNHPFTRAVGLTKHTTVL